MPLTGHNRLNKDLLVYDFLKTCWSWPHLLYYGMFISAFIQCKFLQYHCILIGRVIFIPLWEYKVHCISIDFHSNESCIFQIFTWFLKVTFHLQLLHNIGSILHVVLYVLGPILHPIVCTPPSSTLHCQSLFTLPTSNHSCVLSVSLFLLCYIS